LVRTAKLGFAVLLLWLLYELELLQSEALVELFKSPIALCIAVLLVFASFPLSAWRWQVLLEAQNLNLSFSDLFRVNYTATFLGLYLPGSIGADVARVALGASRTRARMSALALSVVADRLTGLLGLLIVGMLASVVFVLYVDADSEQYVAISWLPWLLGAVFGGVILMIALLGLFTHSLFSHIARGHFLGDGGLLKRLVVQVLEVVQAYRARVGALAFSVFLSTLIHSCALGGLAVVASQLDPAGMSSWKYAIAGAVGLAVNSVPLTPGGLGVGELAFAQVALWLEPDAMLLPYAAIFLAYRVVVLVSLLPALAMLQGQWRRDPED
jgi:glycosyltransferase 2 family protein